MSGDAAGKLSSHDHCDRVRRLLGTMSRFWTLLTATLALIVITSPTSSATATMAPARTIHVYNAASHSSVVAVASGLGDAASNELGLTPGFSPAGEVSSASAGFVAAKTAAGEARVAFGPAPENAWNTLERVGAKGSPLPGYKGGSAFTNDGRAGSQILPRTTSGGDPITYREWDVNPYVKGVDRGGERIVTGSDGTAYYTNDHYISFTQFWGPGG